MPIRPKHVFGKPQPVAPGPFIGRSDLIAVFERGLAVPGGTESLGTAPGFAERNRGSPRPVIVFYGIGGIGKTSLRRRLVVLVESRPSTIPAVLDFQVSNHRTPGNALFMLRRTLGKEHKVKFPTFDIAYAAYWEKTHPGSKLAEEGSALLETSNDIAQIVGSLGVTSVVQLVPKLAIAVTKGSGYRLKLEGKPHLLQPGGEQVCPIQHQRGHSTQRQPQHECRRSQPVWAMEQPGCFP